MANIVRAAIVQTEWTGDKDSMIKKNADYAREAASQGAAIAHQAHGAIGFTAEHILHRFTTRLWAWRDEYGSESEWAVRLGQAVARNGADALWPLVASR